MARRTSSALALDLEQLDLEGQLRVGRDDAGRAARPVGQLGRDGQFADAADLHALHALVPALDDLAGAKREAERPAAILAAVELGAVLEPAGVMDLDGIALGRRRPGPLARVFLRQVLTHGFSSSS